MCNRWRRVRIIEAVQRIVAPARGTIENHFDRITSPAFRCSHQSEDGPPTLQPDGATVPSDLMMKNSSGVLGHFDSGGPKPFDDDDDDLQNSPPRLSPMPAASQDQENNNLIDAFANAPPHLPEMSQQLQQQQSVDGPLSYKNSCEMVNVGGEEASDDSDAEGDCSAVADLDRPPKAPAMQMINDEHDVSQDSDIYVKHGGATHVVNQHHQSAIGQQQQLATLAAKQSTTSHQFVVVDPVIQASVTSDFEQQHVVTSPKKTILGSTSVSGSLEPTSASHQSLCDNSNQQQPQMGFVISPSSCALQTRQQQQPQPSLQQSMPPVYIPEKIPKQSELVVTSASAFDSRHQPSTSRQDPPPASSEQHSSMNQVRRPPKLSHMQGAHSSQQHQEGAKVPPMVTAPLLHQQQQQQRPPLIQPQQHQQQLCPPSLQFQPPAYPYPGQPFGFDPNFYGASHQSPYPYNSMKPADRGGGGTVADPMAFAYPGLQYNTAASRSFVGMTAHQRAASMGGVDGTGASTNPYLPSAAFRTMPPFMESAMGFSPAAAAAFYYPPAAASGYYTSPYGWMTPNWNQPSQ